MCHNMHNLGILGAFVQKNKSHKPLMNKCHQIFYDETKLFYPSIKVKILFIFHFSFFSRYHQLDKPLLWSPSYGWRKSRKRWWRGPDLSDPRRGKRRWWWGGMDSPVPFSVDLLKFNVLVDDPAIPSGVTVPRHSYPNLVVEHPPQQKRKYQEGGHVPLPPIAVEEDVSAADHPRSQHHVLHTDKTMKRAVF